MMLRHDGVAALFQKLRRMQDMLNPDIVTGSGNSSVTHYDLLANLEPQLATHYLEVLQKNAPPHERFKMVAGKAYKGDMVGGAGVTRTNTTHTLESVLGTLPTLDEIRT